ncbi:hypothetical protein NC652_019927 [Populus alba x Populus x berolinensis]|nr:hypothetical protein NC652_019927 [Populus alba x Populus x berolinensis]
MWLIPQNSDRTGGPIGGFREPSGQFRMAFFKGIMLLEEHIVSGFSMKNMWAINSNIWIDTTALNAQGKYHLTEQNDRVSDSVPYFSGRSSSHNSTRTGLSCVWDFLSSYSLAIIKHHPKHVSFPRQSDTRSIHYPKRALWIQNVEENSPLS